MQVMPGTAGDPGYGVRPAQNGSPAEYNRVGRDYFDALHRKYGGDLAKAWAAYNWGPGNLDSLLASHGDNWFQRLPGETQNYVLKNLRAAGRF